MTWNTVHLPVVGTTSEGLSGMRGRMVYLTSITSSRQTLIFIRPLSRVKVTPSRSFVYDSTLASATKLWIMKAGISRSSFVFALEKFMDEVFVMKNING